VVFSYLQDKAAITELFSTISEKVAGRPGGYTRIIKLGTRPGDNAERGLIELVDFNEIYGRGKEEKKEGAKRTRRGRATKKAEGTIEATAPVTQVAEEATPAETVTTPDIEITATAQANPVDNTPEATEDQPS
jgi:large subunit ribosomal protein L17